MKTLFLLGGGGEIGAAIGAVFKSNGYEVQAPRSTELDLADLGAVEAYMDRFTQAPDAFIYCAGHNDPAELGVLSVEEMQRTWQINTLSFAIMLSKLKGLYEGKKQGRILGISSLYGQVSREGRAAYAMSKHAMNGLIQTAALELGPHGVLCNTLSPGFVLTKMTVKNNTPEKLAAFERKIPLGRLADVKDIAQVAYFLCSEQNNYLTGQDIVVDGGFMAGGFQHS